MITWTPIKDWLPEISWHYLVMIGMNPNLAFFRDWIFRIYEESWWIAVNECIDRYVFIS